MTLFVALSWLAVGFLAGFCVACGLPFFSVHYRAMQNAFLKQMDRAIERELKKTPDGWTTFVPAERWDESICKCLCHSTGPWWQSPGGSEYCGTCHEKPWQNGLLP